MSGEARISKRGRQRPKPFNRYSYVPNSPYKFTDPLGLLPLTSAGACGRWCQNSAPFTGSVSGRDATFDHLKTASELNREWLAAIEAATRGITDEMVIAAIRARKAGENGSTAQKMPFAVKITAPQPSLQQNFEVSTSNGKTYYLTGVGSIMEITFESLDGDPLSGLKVTESPEVLDGSIGRGETVLNPREAVTDSKGSVRDMVMNAVFGSLLPEPFGTPLAGSNQVIRTREDGSQVTAAPTIEQIREKLAEAYHSPQRQTLTVTLLSGARYQVVFTRTLSNLDKAGKGGSTYTLTWSSATISRLN